MTEKIKSYVQQIKDAINDEAVDYLFEDGQDQLISYEQLSKLFNESFILNKQYPHSGEFGHLCLKYSKKGEIYLYTTVARCKVWKAKCDINDPKSIISGAIECLNHCMKEQDIDWLHNENVRCNGEK